MTTVVNGYIYYEVWWDEPGDADIKNYFRFNGYYGKDKAIQLKKDLEDRNYRNVHVEVRVNP